MQGYPILFTTDTGASKTIISTRIFDAMRPQDKPVLMKASKLVGASGALINEKGKAIFSLQLGPVQTEVEATVADIDDDGLLGVDVLQNGTEGPTDLLLSKGILMIDNKEVPIIQIGIKNRARRVTAADHFSIPAQSESVIDVYVERKENDDFSCASEYIIEPTKHFQEEYPLQMATTLVDINQGCTCKVRLLNPFPTDMVIKQDAVVGQAEPIDGNPMTLAPLENKEESNNFASVRRIKLGQNQSSCLSTNIPHQIKRIEERCDETVPEHLVGLYEKSSKELDVYEKNHLRQILIKFQDNFSKDEWDLGLTHITEHAIDTGDASPIKQPPRRVPLAFAEEERKAIEDMKAKGVIRDSVSPWASPIVLVKKKDGGIRPCVDYRKVNELVKPDGFPLPRVQDCLDAVAGSTLFSTFDLTSGYYQIPLKKEDIPKSAFVCKFGHFEMTRMPFGLNSAASTFQRTMELALAGLQWLTCLIYIDDIIVFGRNFEEHILRVEQIFERLKQAGLKLKPEKCHMLQKEVTFLGHVVTSEGVKPNPINIAKIMDWPKPKTAKQIKQFVALGSYYRRYVKDFASLVRPMVDLTKKGKRFIWTDACDLSFENLKKSLVSPDVMGYPLNDAGDFILDVDASDVGIGGILHQMQEGRERVIAYASRALNKAERNYCITEKELLAVRFFIEYFRQYLLGRKFVVRTDHQALVWLFKLKEPRGKVARWIEILSYYDFRIEYRPGKKQTNCDALSRCENPRQCECPELDTDEPLKCGPCKKCLKRAQEMLYSDCPTVKAPSDQLTSQSLQGKEIQPAVRGVNANDDQKPGPSKQDNAASCSNSEEEALVATVVGQKSLVDLQKAQSEDPDVGPIQQAKVTGIRPSSPEMVTKGPALRHYWVQWDSLQVCNGVLFKKFVKKDGSEEHLQLIVPQSMKLDVLFQMHDSVISGHLGCKKTKAKILQRFYWYGLRDDVALYIRKCDVCAADKKPVKTPRAPLGSLRTGAPGDCVATDYLGPFPTTERGNRYILLLTDHFSKYVEILPVPDMTAEVCASRILNEYVSRWGCPLSIHSDQGRTYESRVFKEMCRMLEVRKTRTSVRNPKGNGQSERFNRTLTRMIKAYLCGEQKNWDLHLGCLAGAYRSTPSESTKMTPNLLTIGREVRLPAEIIFGSVSAYQGQDITSYGDYVDRLKSRMQNAHSIARRHLESAAKRSKGMYDVKISVYRYNVGDFVWCLNEARKVGIMPKLEHTYDGPFLVTKKYSEVDFLIQTDSAGREKVVNHDKLKPYEGDSPPAWLKKAR
ncbi:MAG: RNase H-like domain-containing protein, partial [Candidatus Thiodiazotropha endolucinida]|nr:DDE-type integrase/transposase/recombinase [Candidatus Thiodiazotropha taylori]MCW4344086.1 RNase H-like domain-containing protein [Candidatus Thiodiazotropha endolucinida]